MQLDAAEVHDPRERRGVVDDREHGRMAARERHRHLVHVVRVLRRHALLVEELAVDAVREPLHVERPPAQVGQRALGDVEVVGDQVALRQPRLREEHLVRVRDRDLVAADAHRRRVGSNTCAGSSSSPFRPRHARFPRRRSDRRGKARSAPPQRRPRRCAKASLKTVNDGMLTVGTDNPAYPPWYAGGSKSSFWKINDPSNGKGFEPAVAYAVARSSGFPSSQVKWVYVAVQPLVRARAEELRLRHQPDLVHAGTGEGRRRSATRTTTSTRRSSCSRESRSHASTRSPGLKPYKLGAQLGTTSYELHQRARSSRPRARPCSRRTPPRSRR